MKCLFFLFLTFICYHYYHSPVGVPPSVFVRNLVDHYLRHGNTVMKVKVYFAEIWATSPTSTSNRRLIPFVQSVELGFGAFNALNQVCLFSFFFFFLLFLLSFFC